MYPKIPPQLGAVGCNLNTTTVQISSLEAVSHLNPDYKRLEKLVLNNNSLVSLAGLETSWVHRTGPSLLDLRNNNIREVSTLSKYLD